jgi:hypothetical protein
MNRLLYTIDSVFHEPQDTPRKQVISASKLAKGDTAFSTTKTLLGWDINTHTMTLALPAHRLAGITESITSFLHKKRTSKRLWQRLLGSLCSTTPALYGAAHYFSFLQHALTATHGPRVRLSPLIQAPLREWLNLATTANRYPVPLHTVVPSPPNLIAATDASRNGMGGFWASPTGNYLWRAPFHKEIQ